MKKKSRYALVVVLMGLVAAAGFSATQQQLEGLEATFEIGEQDVTVYLEVADTRRERKKGMMFRQSLGENRGMLFVFPEEDHRSFWMKNTYIPLDIVFLDSNRTIVNIKEAYPQPNATREELVRYRSGEPAKYVVELNRNFTDSHGIEAGDRLEFDLQNKR